MLRAHFASEFAPKTQDQVSELSNRLAEVAGRLGDQQAKNRALGSEASSHRALVYVTLLD